MFAETLKRLRIKSGKSRYKLAQYSELSEPYILRLESGERANPSRDVVGRLGMRWHPASRPSRSGIWMPYSSPPITHLCAAGEMAVVPLPVPRVHRMLLHGTDRLMPTRSLHRRLLSVFG